MRHSKLISLAIFTLFYVATEAQEDGISFKGQVRTKSIAEKSTENALTPIWHELRTRAAIIGKPTTTMTIHVELQDSRNFGSEAETDSGAFHNATIANSKGIDLHQAFYEVKLEMLRLKAGRQKIELGAQRFISSLEWHPNARAFDAGLAEVTFGPQTLLTGFSSVIRDTLPKAEDGHLSLSGIHFAHSVSKAVGLELFGYLDQSGSLLSDHLLFNIGARMHGEVDMLFYDQEFQFQGGDFNGADKAAFYNATRIGINPDSDVKISIGMDLMSGSDDGSRDNTYEARYFFGHAYFGWMDYFLANPNTGVMDLRLDAEFAFNRQLKGMLQNHYFMQSAVLDGDAYGLEIDAELHGKYFAKSTIILGAGLFVAMGGPGIPETEPGMKIYIMPTFNF